MNPLDYLQDSLTMRRQYRPLRVRDVARIMARISRKFNYEFPRDVVRMVRRHAALHPDWIWEFGQSGPQGPEGGSGQNSPAGQFRGRDPGKPPAGSSGSGATPESVDGGVPAEENGGAADCADNPTATPGDDARPGDCVAPSSEGSADSEAAQDESSPWLDSQARGDSGTRCSVPGVSPVCHPGHTGDFDFRAALCDHGRGCISPQSERAIAAAIMALARSMIAGLGGAVCPRIDARKLAREYAYRRMAVSRARISMERPCVWLAVDVSGSMSMVVWPFFHAALGCARAISALGAEAVVLSHINGGIDTVYARGRIEMCAGDLPVVDTWRTLMRRFPADAVILMADDDGLDIYKELYESGGRWRSTAMVQFHPHGHTRGPVAPAEKVGLSPRPWPCYAGVGTVRQLRDALALALKRR